jgi:phenylpropionate dioxygenase-like ring-hydroxylating dioxygenase large terminal subunit
LEGFVLIHYNPEPPESLREFLGELGERYAGYPFSQMECIASFATVLKANWKTAADAFQEALHVPYIHGVTMGDAFTSPDNPHCHITWAKLYRRHRTGSVYGAAQADRELFPTERVAFSQFAAFTQGADENAAKLPGVNPGGIDNWAFDVNVIFPNCFLDPGNGQYFTMHFWPIDVHTTRWEFRLYMFPTDNPAQKVAQKYTDVVMRDAGLEDLSTIEKTQKMLDSGVAESLPLSDQEILLRHNLSVIQQAIEGL